MIPKNSTNDTPSVYTQVDIIEDPEVSVKNPIINDRISSSEDKKEVMESFSGITGLNTPQSSSLLENMIKTLKNIAFKHWWDVPGVYTVSIATGVRLGGGYIWAGYTGVFYSSLFLQQSSSSSSNSDSTLSMSTVVCTLTTPLLMQ